MVQRTGTYECNSCNKSWDYSELIEDCCGDSLCRGDVFQVSIFPKEDYEKSRSFYLKPPER